MRFLKQLFLHFEVAVTEHASYDMLSRLHDCSWKCKHTDKLLSLSAAIMQNNNVENE